MNLRTPTRSLIVCLFVGWLSTSPPSFGQESVQPSQTAPADSVPAGINDNFKNPELNVDEWIERFEVESREVFAAQEEVLQACEIKSGERIADVGAGTGFYSRLFAKRTGWDGWVFSVDIAPKFLQHIAARATADGIENLTPVLGTDVSIRLPPESVDLVFICDTYHHFEHPQQSLESIYRALKPGGRLVLIDFNRIPGVSREFLIGHVRAPKEVFQAEVVRAGFEYIDEIDIEAFEENYLLRFTKPVETAGNYPPGRLGETVRLGEELATSTSTHPLTKPFVGNQLNCTSCHLEAGTRIDAASFVGVAAAYPAFAPRENAVITLEDRILNCFIRSQNGTRPPNGGTVSTAIAAYITWLSRGTPIAMNPSASLGPHHLTMLDATNMKPDLGRGRALYEERCADCHGGDGHGSDSGPPVWGEQSFNDGAGLFKVPKMASWLKVAMPLDDADLTDEEAFDIAAYVNSHPRPQFKAVDGQ